MDDIERLKPLVDRLSTVYKSGNDEALRAYLQRFLGTLVHRGLGTIRKKREGDQTQLWRFLASAVKWEPLSQAQLFQDLWVIYEKSSKEGGFFVEFGAADGVKLSNTWLLEKHFGWKGILAEPNPQFHPSLAANRDCIVSHECVFSETGRLVPFRCTTMGELSRMAEVDPGDKHESLGRRKDFELVEVSTITLNDLLVKHGAPEEIDYISIDTEGSELEILQRFDFDRWRVGCFSSEHNGQRDKRKAIFDLMAKHGFVRKFEELSAFDDWYVHKRAAAS